MDSNFLKAIETVRNGGIIIYPTDTAFGIGCRIDDSKAVDRLFEMRMRSRAHATPVLVSSKTMAYSYMTQVSDIVRRLADHYWPGALTIVAVCKKERIYSPIRGGGTTAGFRMPNHSVPLSIIRAIGVPMVGTSANFHGKPTPYTLADIDRNLQKRVDLVVPGTCPVGTVSTVVDCSVVPVKVLRQGAVTI